MADWVSFMIGCDQRTRKNSALASVRSRFRRRAPASTQASMSAV